MKLTNLLSRKIIVARRVKTVNDKMAMSTVTAVATVIQPTADSSHQLVEGVFGKSFKLYCDGGVDIQQGDRLRDYLTSTTYTVVSDGVTRRTMGSIDYTIIIVQKTTN